LKYIKLYENFFEDMERAADQAHKTIPFKKPEKKLKPKSEAEPDEERVEVQEPAETQQAEYGVTVDGKRFNETTGDRLVEMPHVPRAYDNQEASAIQRA
jgi:hypothetical protein